MQPIVLRDHKKIRFNPRFIINGIASIAQQH